MERVVGKKIEKEVEKEMDMLQNEIFAVTSPEHHHHYHYQSDSGFSANYGIGVVDGGLSSLPSYFAPSSPSPRQPSPGLESERLMEEYGILERFQAVHVHNNDIWRIPQSTNALIVNPLAEYVAGGDFGDSNPNVDWVAELVEQKRLANVFLLVIKRNL